MNRKLRISILCKIAQQTTSQDTPAGQPATTTTVSGSPPPFKASEYYPSMIVGFTPRNVPWVNGLANTLNTALFYTSNGQVHMPWMRQVNFNFSTDQSPSVDLRNIMDFSKLVYNQLFTNNGSGYQQALNTQQIADKVRVLSTSPYFNNLSQVNPTGQLGSKLGGNLKTIINNYLLQIK